MEKGEPLEFSKADLEALQNLSDLLHLFHHRNKNQHRRSIWWRYFQTFRKQINDLTAEIKGLNDVPTTHLARTQKKAKDPETLRKIGQRLAFWQDVMVSQWQNSFSQVSADARFAVLGLVLMAALAEACRVFGVTAAFEELAQAEVEKVLEQFAEEGWMRSDGMHDDEHDANAEDVGEVIRRTVEKEDDAGIMPRAESRQLEMPSLQPGIAALRPGTKRTTAKIEKSVKKKRRKGNAIDDLFSGLG